VCIKDHRGGRAFGDFPVPGQGEIDFEATFRTLFGVGFRGPLSLERVDGMLDATGMSGDLIDQRIKEAYAFLKPLLDKCVGP
jgi:sugar phosphate isomerase/epimerase